MYQIDTQHIITDKTQDNLVRVNKETWPYLIEYRISESQVYVHIDHSYIPYLTGGINGESI